MLKAFLRFLGAVDGEERQMWFLLGMGALMGFFLASYQVGSESLFIQVLGEEYLSESFFVTGALGILFTMSYVYLQKRIKFSRLVIGNAVIISLFVCGLRLAFEFIDVGDKSSGFSVLPFLLFVMMGPMTAILLLGFWGIFGRIFDTRQTKRLIGSVDTGQLIATIIAFFSIPILTRLPFFNETYDLLLISSISVIGILVLTILMCLNWNVNLIDSLKKESSVSSKGYVWIFKNKFTRLLSFFMVFSMGTAIFLDYVFYSATEIKYPNEQELNDFLSFFNGTVIIMSFIIQTFINDIILNRFGLKVALMTMPIILILFMIGGIISGHIYGFEILNEDFLFFFMFVISGKAFTASLRDALESPAFKLFFLPFDLTVRFDIQNRVEGVIGQFATFAAGLIQMGIATMVFFKVIHFIYFIISIAGMVIYLSVKLYNQYKITLKETLVKQRTMLEEKGKLKDNNVFKMLKHELKSNQEHRVLNALRLLERLDPIDYQFALLDQLTSEYTDIRKYSYLKIEEIKAFETFEIIRQSVKKEEDPEVLITAKKTLNSLKVFIDYELNDESIRRYVRSTLASDRIYGARLLAKIQEDKHVAYLMELLRDINPEVRNTAIITAGKLKRPEIWGLLIENLHLPAYSNTAISALKNSGERVLYTVDAAFFKTGQYTATMIRIVQIIGMIGGKQSEELLWKKIDFPNKRVNSELLASLGQLLFEAQEFQAARIKLIIEGLIADIAWNIKAVQDVPQKQPVDPLDMEMLKGLREENTVNFKNLFMLLSMIYDAQDVMLVKENLDYGTTDSVTFALEMMDVFVEDEIKPMLMPILDDLSDKDRLEALLKFFPPEEFVSYADLLTQIVNRDYNRITRYTKSLAINKLHLVDEPEVTNALIANLFNPDVLLLQSAANTIYKIDANAYRLHTNRLKLFSKVRLDKIILPAHFVYDGEEYHQKMLLVERVRFLKSLPFLSKIPGDLITLLVDAINERKVPIGTKLIQKGDKGDQLLFFIIAGTVEVTQDGVLQRTVGPKEMIGEELVLASEQFDFEAKTLESTTFLMLSKDDLFDLMSLHFEILEAFMDVIDLTKRDKELSLDDSFDLSILDDRIDVFK
ncbi:MAG: HEAT repeat domain-containing protein [Flammeovirgaceae bacterium]|nr:HEAT repeat domain-containing protein [Flammeovirgaceae bacterium]